MKNIGIFCGGFSSEFDISMKSARTILAAMPKDYRSFLIVVRPNAWEVLFENESSILDLNDLGFETKNGRLKVDIGLVYIHGNPGENGKIQAFLEMKSIPCINSGALASELSFDKWFCNQFLKGFGIHVAESILLTKKDSWSSEKIVEQLSLPIFVKPADSGSSFGISKVKSMEELPEAIEKAFQEGETVVLEAFLDGTELTCGVYRNENGLRALPLAEIIADTEFFDYEAKYLGKSQEIIPARISEVETKKVQEAAMKIYQILRLRSISRIDFMLVNGIPHLIEVNTTPGFSDASIVPQMLEKDGVKITEFWNEIIKTELPNSL